jgi:hypothetical protein
MKPENDRAESTFLCGWLAFTAVSLLIVVLAGLMIGPNTAPEVADHLTQLQYIGIALVCLSAFVCLPIGSLALEGQLISHSYPSNRGHLLTSFQRADASEQPTWSTLKACFVTMSSSCAKEAVCRRALIDIYNTRVACCHHVPLSRPQALSLDLMVPGVGGGRRFPGVV